MMLRSITVLLAFILLLHACNSKDSSPDIINLELDVNTNPFEIIGDNYIKNISLKNKHESENFRGTLTIKVTSNEGSVIYKRKSTIFVAAHSETDHMFTFHAPHTESYKIEYVYKLDGAQSIAYEMQNSPYILTPPESPEPSINGPDVFGVRSREPLHYTLTVTGSRPMTFSAEGLPDGIVFDSIHGKLGGSIRLDGSYPVTFTASNSLGVTQKQFTIQVGDTTQLLPEVNWKSWLAWDSLEYQVNLTADEQYSHVSLRCMQSAPVLFNNVFSGLDDFTLNLLTNSEVLAVNQDASYEQAELVYTQDSIKVWMKDLSDGSKAVAFFNMDNKQRNAKIAMNALQLSGTYTIRDLWRQKDVGEASDEIKVSIYPHGVYLTKLKEK